jgi:DNA-binding protein YbaB
LAETVDRGANQALRARFDEVHDEYQRLRAGLDELQHRLADLRVRERSDDGQVTVTVGARGQVVSVDLDPAIYRDRDAGRLSRTITTTVNRATLAAVAATQELVAGYLPTSSGAVDFLRTGEFGALLGRSDAAMRETGEARD